MSSAVSTPPPTDLFRVVLEAAPTGMILVDDRGRIVLVNGQIERLFGYSRDELVGRPIEMLVPEAARPRHPDLRAGFLRQPSFRPMGAGRDLFGLRRDGTEIPIEIGLNPLETATGNFVLGSVVDITERKHAEAALRTSEERLRSLNADLEERVEVRTVELKRSLAEREVLLREVHHRVKNNLQVIASLINMQLRTVPDVVARGALEECQNRVRAIALIHEKLYQSQDYARVRLSDYARTLATNVFHATGVSSSSVALVMEVETLSLAVDRAIPCGLILNELITNVLKHAFPEGREGTLRIVLRSVDERDLMLAVEDDGVGLPPEFDAGSATSLGIRLVSMLAEQLGGRLEVGASAARGTTARVVFPRDGQARTKHNRLAATSS